MGAHILETSHLLTYSPTFESPLLLVCCAMLFKGRIKKRREVRCSSQSVVGLEGELFLHSAPPAPHPALTTPIWAQVHGLS